MNRGAEHELLPVVTMDGRGGRMRLTWELYFPGREIEKFCL